VISVIVAVVMRMLVLEPEVMCMLVGQRLRQPQQSRDVAVRADVWMAVNATAVPMRGLRTLRLH
jgi:hypothetical protein